MTSDGGNTWVDIVGKRIPQAPVNDVIRHPSKPKWLFVATDVGVFRTTNLGTTWIKVGANLPLVPINDIDLPGSDTLYAATYGRCSTQQPTVAASGRTSWASYPRWRNDEQALVACAQTLELTDAMEFFLRQFCDRHVLPLKPPAR